VERDRDVAAFERRAQSYEHGWLGRWHVRLARDVARRVIAIDPAADRVLDVGCGTGALLRELSRRATSAEELVGVDAAAGMVAVARARLEGGTRARVEVAEAESLPFDDDSFDVVVSTLSFDHWADQQRGLAECARVLRPRGTLVLVDLFSPLLWPTTMLGRRGRARTIRRAARRLRAAGFTGWDTERLYPLIRMIITVR